VKRPHRRQFLRLTACAAGLGSVAVRPVLARAQQPAVPVIGFLNSGSFDRYRRLLDAFRQGLNERRVCRGPERRNREPLGGGSSRSATRAGGRSGSPPGVPDCRHRRLDIGARGEGRHHDNSGSFYRRR